MSMKVPLITLVALLSCIANVFFLEKLISNSPKASNLITASSFLVLTVDGFLFTSQFGTKKPVVPLRYYALLVCIFFVTNITNNWVFRFHVPMTLHMIFKSASLITSLILGVILLKKKYETRKYFSVILITLGIIMCTYSDALLKHSKAKTEGSDNHDIQEFLIGIGLLTFTLLSSAYMGILQERIANQFGKYPRESLFYSHMLPLPFFGFLYKDIYDQIVIFNDSEPTVLPIIGTIPYLWVYLICNTFFQYICINCVFQLTAECSSLTVTLIITIRKFLSLLISIFYFGNPFTVLHWIGTVHVFAGSAIFADLHTIFAKPRKEKSL